MNANASNSKPVVDDSGLGDGGEIGNLPRFAPPEPETRPQRSDGVPGPAKAEAAGLPQAETGAGRPEGTANESGPTVILKDDGSTEPVSAKAAAGTAPSAAAAASSSEGSKGELAEASSETGDGVKKESPGRSAPQVKSHEPERDLQRDDALSVEEQLRAVAAMIMADRGTDPAKANARVTREELDRVAQHLTLQGAVRPEPSGASMLPPIGAVAAPGPAAVGVPAGQALQMRGGAAVAEGVGALVGGALNLVGAAGKMVGQAAHHVADLMKGAEADKQAAATHADAASGLPAVLPRLSEYRIAQVEKAAAGFGREADAFWNASTKLTALRSEIERVARERGLAVQDVTEEMKPGGDFAELRNKFNAAVADNPDSGARRKAMDKALESYVRQYGRAQEELLNPEQNGNPHYDRYKERLRQAHDDIELKASGLPAFENSKGELDPSHFEKLKEAVAKVMEKLKEVAKEFVAMFRGKAADDEHAPSP